MSSKAAKSALVTGASRGIGRAIALELAAQGHAVLVNYVASEAGARSTVDAIRSTGGTASAVQGDVRRPGDLDRLFEAVAKQFGRLDVLVNNAGVGATAPLEQIDAALFEGAMSVNAGSVLLASQRAVPAFGSHGGAIVNVSSALVVQPFPTQAVYAASKAAVESITRVLAQELGSRGIRVNAVAPGPTDTDLLQADDQVRGFIASRTVLGRLGQPADIAKVVAFLASDAAGWVTGQVIGVDGGLRL